MRFTQFAVPAIVAVFGLTVLTGCRKAESVAMVNGEPITKEEFYAYLERKPNVRISTNQGPVDTPPAEPLGFQALRDMVNRRILIQLAKDEGVYPTPEDIKSELAYRETIQRGFMSTLQKNGLTLEQIQQEIIVDLCQFRLVTKGVKISEAQVNKFIATNPKLFQEPARAELLWVVVDNEKEKAVVDGELKSGQTFSVVAMKYSKAPGARENQGRFPIDAVDRFPAELKAVVDATGENQASNWIPQGPKSIKFYVGKKTAAKKIEIDASLKERVRRQLALNQGSKGTDLNKRLLTKLKGSKVDVTKVGLTDLWNNAFKTLKAEDITTGGSAAPGSTTTEKPTENKPQ